MIKTILFSSEKGGSNLALLILRLTFGLLMLSHGWAKWEAFDTLVAKEEFPSIIISVKVSLILAILAELCCSLLVVVGAFTRIATIPIIFTMLVAIFVIHLGDPLAQKELALLYLAGYTTILIMGPGKISIDAMIKK
ncbi:DoxX family protein [Halosquirtibacter xylanolyticus]|uniref:DoxX family protein n=1 Tax=Halosquirtibacter xylanolyticus TaxID=3374599 RepID=UPI0037483AA4|nr:DoxX family protein [Prolixibacteraceae bacterium]